MNGPDRLLGCPCAWISSRKAWHQGNDLLMQVAHDIVGPCHWGPPPGLIDAAQPIPFPATPSETHQPIAVLHQDDANLRDQRPTQRARCDARSSRSRPPWRP